VYVGSHSQLYTLDREYSEAFDVVAYLIFVLFALGLFLKIVYYLTCHLWSDLIWTRTRKLCS